MLGSEGRLGQWKMPEREPDMQQKTRDNLQTLANVTAFVKMRNQLAEVYPDKKIVFKQKDGTRLAADKQVKTIWEGAGGGALTELAGEGLLDQAVELVRSVREGEVEEE